MFFGQKFARTKFLPLKGFSVDGSANRRSRPYKHGFLVCMRSGG